MVESNPFSLVAAPGPNVWHALGSLVSLGGHID